MDFYSRIVALRAAIKSPRRKQWLIREIYVCAYVIYVSSKFSLNDWAANDCAQPLIYPEILRVATTGPPRDHVSRGKLRVS